MLVLTRNYAAGSVFDPNQLLRVEPTLQERQQMAVVPCFTFACRNGTIDESIFSRSFFVKIALNKIRNGTISVVSQPALKDLGLCEVANFVGQEAL